LCPKPIRYQAAAIGNASDPRITPGSPTYAKPVRMFAALRAAAHDANTVYAGVDI
jgi:hypothetical protein